VATTHVDMIDKTIEKTNIWLGELADALGSPDSAGHRIAMTQHA
jgi:hypothetical protein